MAWKVGVVCEIRIGDEGRDGGSEGEPRAAGLKAQVFGIAVSLSGVSAIGGYCHGAFVGVA
jgi:hypothetical protein